MLNVVILEGRLTREPEVITTQNGNKLIKLSVVHNRSYKDANQQWNDVPNFFDVVLVGNVATSEKIASLPKGTRITLQGSLRQERWTDKEGKNRSKVVIYSDRLSIAYSTKDQSNQQEEQVEEIQAQAKAFTPEDSEEDDIPF